MESGAFTLKHILRVGCCAGGKDPSCWCEAAAQRDACYSGQREREKERAFSLLGQSAEGKTEKAAGKVSTSSLMR